MSLNLEAIRQTANDKYEGSLEMAIAEELYGSAVILKCGGQLPIFADMARITEIKNQIEPPPDPPPPPTLEVVKDTFKDSELLEIVLGANRNNWEIGKQISIAIYGDNAIVNGDYNQLVNRYKVGQTKAQITRLLTALKSDAAEKEAEEEAEDQGGN